MPPKPLPPPPSRKLRWVLALIVLIAIGVGAVVALILRPSAGQAYLGRWELLGGFDDHPCGRATVLISVAKDRQLDLAYYGLCSGTAPDNFQPMDPFSLKIQGVPLQSRRVVGVLDGTLITVEPVENDLLIVTVYGNVGRLAQRIFRRAGNDEADLPTPLVVATLAPNFSLEEYVSGGHPALDFLLLTPDGP